MTEPKWTPGPWIFEPHPMYGEPRGEDQWPFGHISTRRPTPIFEMNVLLVFPKDELFANARLIAAAPELYEALRLHKVYEDIPTDRGGLSGTKGKAHAAWIAARDAALAKARGE